MKRFYSFSKIKILLEYIYNISLTDFKYVNAVILYLKTVNNFKTQFYFCVLIKFSVITFVIKSNLKFATFPVRLKIIKK